MPSALTNRIIDEVARELVARWKTMTHFPLDSWYALHFVAEEMGCVLELRPCVSSYDKDELLPKPNGLAAIDSEQSDMHIIRTAAHELGHHGLYWWTAWGWRWRWPIVTDMDSKAFEEAICNRIADLVWALPEQMEPDGTIGLPNLPPVARFYQRNPIPKHMAMPAAEIDAIDKIDAPGRAEEEKASAAATLFLPEQTNLNSPI